MESFFPSEDEGITCAKNPTSHFLFNFIGSTPFVLALTLNPNFPLLITTCNVVREVQKSIFSNADKCLKILDEFRSQNGVVDKIMSFSSYLHDGCQLFQFTDTHFFQRRNFQSSAMLSNSNFAAILPGDSMAGVVVSNGIMNFLNIYNNLLVVRLVLTWFPNAPPAVVNPISTLCDPYLNIFRGIIPPLGGTLDLSPIIAFLVLSAFTSVASALPAELPSSQVSEDIPSTTTTFCLTASRKKWMRRLSASKSKCSNREL